MAAKRMSLNFMALLLLAVTLPLSTGCRTWCENHYPCPQPCPVPYCPPTGGAAAYPPPPPPPSPGWNRPMTCTCVPQ